MKKLIAAVAAALLVLALVVGGIYGCSPAKEPDPEYTTTLPSIYVQKDGKITETTRGAFDKEIYDQDEFTIFVKKNVAEYNTKTANLNYSDAADVEEQVLPVSVDSVEKEDKEIVLKMTYATAKDFVDFNKEYQNLAQGAELEACLVGEQTGDFTGVNFIKAEDNSAVDKDTALEVSKNESKMTHLISINFAADVYVEGKILYTSDQVTIEDGKAIIKGAEGDTLTESAAPAYIVFR